MKNALEDIIIEHIRAQGPLDVGAFMALSLSHPDYGYYMTRDPFGRGGDFTTAPEISQMFGEILGAWVVDVWDRLGRPDPFILLECGPGRGTLMADVLRVGAGVSGFLTAAQVHLLEISPVLKSAQAQTLAGTAPQFHAGLETVPQDVPLIVLANEFLDALPFHQLQKRDGMWQERVVDVENGRFVFGLRVADKALIEQIPLSLKLAEEGCVFEVAPARVDFVRDVAARVATQRGAGMFIDYGPRESGLGDTFQALKNNGFANVLENVGEVDLTSHVDFGALKGAVHDMNVSLYGPVLQGEFLKSLGIGTRARALMARAEPEKAAQIQKDLHRLIDSDQMGHLFKVLCFEKMI